MTSVAGERLARALDAAQLRTWTWDMAAGTTVWDVRLEPMHGLEPGGTYEAWVRAECLARVGRALANPGPHRVGAPLGRRVGR